MTALTDKYRRDGKLKRRLPPEMGHLRAALHYNPETGIFTHKRNSAWGKIGNCAGSRTSKGYIELSIDQTRYLAHQVAWYYVHKIWPEEVDHKNGNPADNRIENLRLTSRSQNMANTKGWASRKNSLPKGVYKVTEKNGSVRYIACITKSRKQRYLGYYRNIDEAAEAYKKTASELFGEFAR